MVFMFTLESTLTDIMLTETLRLSSALPPLLWQNNQNKSTRYTKYIVLLCYENIHHVQTRNYLLLIRSTGYKTDKNSVVMRPGRSRNLHWPISAISSLLRNRTKWLRFASATPGHRASGIPSSYRDWGYRRKHAPKTRE